MPAFNCANGVEVPDTQGNAAAYPNETCDRPNVLNGVCDKGSKFQVLVDTQNSAQQHVVMVAHCRHKGAADPNSFSDTAVIAYNYSTGDTCFFQDKDPQSPDPLGTVPAPSNPNALNFWGTPAGVASQNCVGCHANGPFVRTPYLTQLLGTPATEAGTAEIAAIVAVQTAANNRVPKAILPGSRDSSWNSTQPYRFVGADFQGWKAYALSVQTSTYGAGRNQCTTCHRMGLSSNQTGASPQWFNGMGSTLNFGRKSTGDNGAQSHKNPHTGTLGATQTSPIWMLPSQQYFKQPTLDEQELVRTCGLGITSSTGGALPAGCNYAQFAQGNTCRGATIVGTINGATQGPSSTTPQNEVVDIPAGPDIAFGGWTALHGPFIEASVNTPFDSAGFDGSFASIGVATNPTRFQIRAGWLGATQTIPRAGAGGAYAFTKFSEIAGLANPTSGTYSTRAIDDLAGTTTFLSPTLSIGLTAFNIPMTFIGNLTSSTNDFFGITQSGTTTRFTRSVAVAAPAQGIAWSARASGWTPNYSVLNVRSTSDIQLIAASNTGQHRCFITAIGGDWSMKNATSSVEPSAEIYQSSGAIRLRVVPVTTDSTRVFAEASCIQIQ